MVLIELIISCIFLHKIYGMEVVPYSPPLVDASPANLFKRDSKCGTPCSGMGAEVCCAKKAVCALDQAGNVACCPHNSVCTGTIAAGPAPTNAPTGAPSAPTPGAAISHAISGTSTLSNQYYPFPVLPTPFSNEGDCSAAFSSCQAESAKCTGFVEGGGYGVTIAGQNGQITQQAAMPASSAESICSSLSQEACHGLQPSQCPTLAGAKASAGAGGFVVDKNTKSGAMSIQGNAVYGLGIGLLVGLAGDMAW